MLVLAPPAVVSFDRVRDQVLGTLGHPRADGAARLASGSDLDTTATPSQSTRTDRADPVRALVREQVGGALRRQSAAMLAGDLTGFLAPTDPSDLALRADLRRRFDTLRSMQVAGWEQTVAGEPAATGDGSWSVPVQLRYCFVVPGCPTVGVTVATRWATNGGTPRLLAFSASATDQVGPRPWEVTELHALIGKRVVIAGSGRWASRLPGFLNAADHAANIADRYARWGDPPGRYVVYVAGPDEWSQWYGVQQASWVAAYAMPLTDTYTEIVLNADKVGVLDADEVLRHEFSHVVTLAGVNKTYPNSWWLVEGIAEYVQNVGRSVRTYPALADGRRYVRGSWNGNVALDEPDPTASTSEANGHYAVVYLAVRRLAERFGEPRMLEFFSLVARTGKGLEAASVQVFGLAWAEVSGDCARSVRRSVG